MKHILSIPSWYVAPTRPDIGIYFREQALFFRDAALRSGVLYLNRNMAGWPQKLLKRQWAQFQSYSDTGIFTYRMDGLFPPLWCPYTQKGFAHEAIRLFETYQKEQGKPDVILAHSYLAAFVAAAIKIKYGVPFAYAEVLTLLKDLKLPPGHRVMLDTALQEADVLTAVSPALADWMKAVTDRSIDIVPLGVDTRIFAPGARPKPDVFTFIYVGDFIHRRGVDVLEQALRRLNESRSDFRVLMLGIGPLQAGIRQQLDTAGMGERIVWQGLANKNQVAEHLQQAHCLVLPSRLETFGVVVTEALSSGIPVIASRCGGPESILTPAQGILVGVNDISALAQAMEYMIEHIAEYSSTSLRERVLNRFGHQSVTQQWLDIFEKITKKAG